jgi:hypothetical protein
MGLGGLSNGRVKKGGGGGYQESAISNQEAETKRTPGPRYQKPEPGPPVQLGPIEAQTERRASSRLILNV